ncbi:MAG: hypothetical protein AAFU58_02190, partial [Pseudomonadota bacterium]
MTAIYARWMAARLVLGATAILLAGCVTPREPVQTVTGTYLSGRLAARVNDTKTAAENFAIVQSVAPGNG